MPSDSLIKKIRTRFAPSPTGELHIGGARTALFNYLLATSNDGEFVIRVEDTDIKRNKEEFVISQNEDLLWLGIEPHESIFKGGLYEPYRQTERIDKYLEYARLLVEKKKAYFCFCTKEELDKERQEYKLSENRLNYQYSKKCLNLNEDEVKRLISEGKSHVIRLNVPREEIFCFNDLVRREVKFSGKDIEDFIIVRENGIPNYNFSCVIDDYLMKITHVLRGEEHLSNTGKQLAIYQSFNWKNPLFGHISVILNKERKKLSKRELETNPFQKIRELREMGYLPQAIINYLLFLGWNPKSKKEIFDLEEMKSHFNLQGLNPRGAVYELSKLNWFNNYYIKNLDLATYNNWCWKFLSEKYQLSSEKKEWVYEISNLFREQLNFFHELIELTSFFFSENKKNDEDKENDKKLEIFLDYIKSLKEWSEEEIRSCLNLASEKGKKEIFLKIRKKITWKEKGPELPKIIFLLGKEEVIKRLLI